MANVEKQSKVVTDAKAQFDRLTEEMVSLMKEGSSGIKDKSKEVFKAKNVWLEEVATLQDMIRKENNLG